MTQNGTVAGVRLNLGDLSVNLDLHYTFTNPILSTFYACGLFDQHIRICSALRVINCLQNEV